MRSARTSCCASTTLQIQREALGFTRHTELDEHYPVPARKPEPAR